MDIVNQYLEPAAGFFDPGNTHRLRESDQHVMLGRFIHVSFDLARRILLEPSLSNGRGGDV